MMKELKESQPLWKRLLALSAALILGAAALAFPSLGGVASSDQYRVRRVIVVNDPLGVRVQIVAQLRPRRWAGPAEITRIFRD